MNKILLSLMSLGILFMIQGCGDPGEPYGEVIENTEVPDVEVAQSVEPVKLDTPAAEPKEETSSPVKSISTNSGLAAISGVVRFDGEVPQFKPIKMDADPLCAMKHKEAVLPQTLILGDLEKKTMANVFVRITSGLTRKNFPTPAEAVVIDQKGCMYDPHVIGVMVNQPVRILNSDGTLHNVHALPKVNSEFNLAMPKFRTETTASFNQVEFMFPIKCDVHPWMGAWITVMDHPFYNVTKLDGLYVIGDIPPGNYELEAWHEKLGTKTMSVVLSAGEHKTIDFTFSK